MTADWATYLHDHITLTASDQTRHLLHACQLFALRFDTYLNARCRDKPYPQSRLDHHRQQPLDVDYEWPFTGQVFHPDTQSVIKICLSRQTSHYHHPAVCSQADLLTRIQQATVFLHRTFGEQHWILAQPLTVFRCLVLDHGRTPDWHFRGFTSTSYRLTSALQFVSHAAEPFHTTRHVCYVLKVDLPPGTRFVPLSLSSVQEEHEILVVSQGTLDVQPSSQESVVYWNPIQSPHKDNVLPFTLVPCALQLSSRQPRLSPFRLSTPDLQ